MEGRLTLISAPAGFGKSTVLSEWLSSRSGSEWPVAWLSLDESDNDPTRFWGYFGAALDTLQAGVGQKALAALQSPQPPSIELVLTTLINEITVSLDDFALVLDDYHVIDVEAIHNAVEFLLDHLPSQMHIVMATRIDPPLPLSRLRARGELAEVRAIDLRFTPDEASSFFNQVMGLDLSGEDVAALGERTEGWIAGLHLAALSMQGRKDIRDFVSSFSGSHRYVFDYLANEVLNRQSPGVQSFLLQTSILDRLTGPLCDAVTGQVDSQITLEMLHDSNLFITPLDEDRRWYRYHHLFAEFLHEHLYERHMDRVAGLHRLASTWHEKNGSMAEALQQAFSARDFDRAADLLEQVAGTMSVGGEFATVRGWLGALPEQVVRSRARLCVLQAMGLFMAGNLDAVEPFLRQAELLVSDAKGAEQGSADGGAAELMGGVAAIRGFVACMNEDVGPAVEYSRQALERLPKEASFMRSMVTFNLVANLKGASDSRGDVGIDEAKRAMSEAVGLSRAAGDISATLMGLGYTAEIEEAQGHLTQAETTCREALKFAAEQEKRRIPVAGIAHAVLGNVLRERNYLAEAKPHMKEAIDLAKQADTIGAIDLRTRLSGCLGLARLLQAQGDETALQVIDEADHMASQSGVPPLYVDQIKAYQAWLRLARGDLGGASLWARECGLSVGDEFGEAGEGEYLILARVLIAQGKSEEAIALLDWLLGKMDSAGLTRSVIETLALRALALELQGNNDEALSALQRALSLAEPEGFVRVFVDEGAPMATLLRLAASRGIALGYVTRLLEAFEGTSAARQKRGESLKEPLSERELEVLRLVSAGMTNAQIAVDLVVALSTVKTHINNIYGKLEVQNRTQAVARAREIHLLE